MKRFFYTCLGALTLTITGSLVAYACGGYFSMWRLVDNRDDILRHIQQNSIFEDNIAAVVKVDAKEKSYFQATSNKYLSGDTACKGMDHNYQQAADLYKSNEIKEAQQSFIALIDKGSSEQQVCVLYSLAKIEQQQGNSDQALRYFQSTINLVKKGAFDPLQLGASAYGQMGSIYLNKIGDVAPNGMSWKLTSPDKNTVLTLHRALYAYANQLIYNGDYARASINVILDEITKNTPEANALLNAAVQDHFIRDFFLAYIFAIGSYDDSEAAKKRLETLMQTFASSVDVSKDPLADFSNLSAFAYQHGDIKSAQKLADFGWNRYHRSVDAWVLAKISLFHNDKEAAQKYYHLALQNKDLNGDLLTSTNHNLMIGENAMLTLSKGDFLQALEELWPVRSVYFNDVAYICENLLTLDELKQFADQHSKPMMLTQKQENDPSFWYSEPTYIPAFRSMVARRLLRENHPQEAIPYFVTSKERDLAIKYAKNYDIMKHETSAIPKAKATWNIAVMMRENGMELAGTQGYPDLYPGWGYMDLPENKADAQWITRKEESRLHQYIAIPNWRYHYRSVAADYAVDAAKLLPPRSQAYAAILCNANGWLWGNMDDASDNGRVLNDRDPQRWQKDIWANKEQDIYKLYVKNGALVPFAQHFGRDCPDPQFDTANISVIKMWWWDFYANAKDSMHHMLK